MAWKRRYNKRVVSLEFNRLIEYYQKAEEIHQPEESSSKGMKADLVLKTTTEMKKIVVNRKKVMPAYLSMLGRWMVRIRPLLWVSSMKM